MTHLLKYIMCLCNWCNRALALSFSQSLSVVEHYFPQYAIVEQDILGSKESLDKVLALLPDDILSSLVVLSP